MYIYFNKYIYKVLFISIVSIVSIFGLPTMARAEKNKQAYPELMFARNLAPASRFQLGYRDRELKEHKYYERYQTVYANLEYAIYPAWSLYASIPYTTKYLTDTETKKRLDNVLVGTRLGWDQKHWMPVMGIEIELATGDEKETGIGSKELGSLEPYFGIMYARRFVVSAAIRFNAQTNKQFKEKEEQNFDRTWLFDLTTGYRFNDVDLMLEYTYKYRQDPELNMLSTHIVAPAIHYRFTPDIQLGLSVPYTTSKEREFDIGGKLELTVYY